MKNIGSISSRDWLVLSAFVLWFGLLAITSMVQKSATFDEPNKLISGYANINWRDYRLAPDHPPLARIINALPLLALNIRDPRHQNHLWKDSLVSDNAQRLFTQAMLYRVDADWILFWERIPVVRVPGTLVTFWYSFSSQGIYPRYLAYFNEFTGGPDSGYKVLVDCNLD